MKYQLQNLDISTTLTQNEKGSLPNLLGTWTHVLEIWSRAHYQRAYTHNLGISRKILILNTRLMYSCMTYKKYPGGGWIISWRKHPFSFASLMLVSYFILYETGKKWCGFNASMLYIISPVCLPCTALCKCFFLFPINDIKRGWMG